MIDDRQRRIERQRRYRERRKLGLRLYPVALDRWQVSQLIDSGLVDEDALNDADRLAEQLADALEVAATRSGI